MRLKQLFLSMFVAVIMISCDNMVIENEGNENDLPEIEEGIPTYASFNFNIMEADTYAGDSEVTASTEETAISNAVMYIYKFNGVGMAPESAVYLSSFPTSKTMIIRTTSGQKKIFLALNPVNTNNSFPLVPIPNDSYQQFGTPFNDSFNSVNNTLYTAGSTTWGLTQTAGITTKADGLIRALANNRIGEDGSSLSGYMLMTNWDGPNDDNLAQSYQSTCLFTVAQDIVNYFTINVQRAFAKIKLNLSIPYTTRASGNYGDSFSDFYYEAGDAYNKGRFQPWSVSTGGYGAVPIWTIGNIPKQTLPFQLYIGNKVRDVNYLATDDSIRQFSKWVSHYDNTRVFPDNIPSYPYAGLTVDAVKNVMRNSLNCTNLQGSLYTIENARENPVTYDYGTYIIMGGRYHPENIITHIERAVVPTNQPTFYFNGSSTSTRTPYGYELQATDTAYFLVGPQIFILGKNNVLRYYAWDRGIEQYAPADGSGFTGMITRIVNNDLANRDILAYAGGQCFYRVFITDDSAQNSERVVVRRNHIYVVNVTEIRGPGIDDPNFILQPDQPKYLVQLDSYVSADINVLNWHQVDKTAVWDK